MSGFQGGQIITSSFEPFPLLKNQHLQTLWPTLFRSAPLIQTKRERFITKDNDFIDVDWYEQTDRPLILLIHGLASSSRAKYIMGLQKSLAQHGYASVAMNLRGCSGEPNNKLEGYHGGMSEDLDFVMEALIKRFPHRLIGAVGFSLGANIMLKWLSESPEKKLLFGAISVSAPLQLNLATERLQQGFSKIYEQYLLNFMKWHQYQKHQKLRRQSLDFIPQVEKLLPLWKIHTIFDFDDHITAPLHGFKNAAHYYEVCSSRSMLKSIQTPTLILHAEDDPFIPLNAIPKQEELSPHVMLELSQKGGHVGFISKNKKYLHSYWVEERVPQFFTHLLN